VGSREKYARQHEVHRELMPPATESVTDVGCGIATFYEFLKGRGCAVSYTGIDLVPEFIAANAARYPEAAFAVRDILVAGLPGSPDHVVMCQVFNNRFSDSDNFAVVQRAIAVAFAAARLSVSIDMLSTHVNYQEPHLCYYDPAAVFAFARSLTPYVVLRHDYAPHHFTVGLYKQCTTGSA
jgi:SAM-dependent methyltransferase